VGDRRIVKRISPRVRPIAGAALAALVACTNTPGPKTETKTDAWLNVLSVNVGNLDEVVDKTCGVAPYQGGLCSFAQEEIIAANLARLRPDIAFLTELVDSGRCEPDSWEGDTDLICTGAPDRDPKEQVRRLVGDDYTISCASTHATCVAVLSERVTLHGCAAGELCLDGNDTAPHPDACGTMGSRTSVSRIDTTVDDVSFALIPVHALNALNQDEDPCRLAQFNLALEDVSISADALIAGDWNMDPYRAPDAFPSGIYWHTQVGPEARFTAHNVPGDGSTPTPTWATAATLDFVLSDFLQGECDVLGETEGTTRIDGEDLATMDHRAVWCALSR
jgi:hypothetical protein